MIELRWLVKRVSFDWNADGNVVAVKKNVLQYRVMAPYAAANGNMMWPLEPNWTDWQDVPTVREEG